MNKYKFHFNIQYARDLRDAVNDRQKQSVNNVHRDKQITGDYLAWDRICAAMDRLEDTLIYLNYIEIGGYENGRTAFDFFDFVNNSYVVIDCIKTIGRIFRLEDQHFKSIENSTSVFGTLLSERSTDGKYFEYIRSLCVVHPLCTNRQEEFLNGSRFHCCPMVIWKGHFSYIGKENADLTAVVYSSRQGEDPLYLGLYVRQFEEYLEKWINLIPKIIEAKNNYTDKEYERLRKEPVKYLSDYSNDVVQYLSYLKEEYCKRFDYADSFLFDCYIRLFTTELSDSRNQELLTKYRNAIVYSLQFVRNELQNMSYEGYENNGVRFPEKNVETTLFNLLDGMGTNKSAFTKYAYNLEKLYYLEDDYYWVPDKHYARRLLEEPKELINQYVYFTNSEPDAETIVIVKLALYLEALSRESSLNKNIPNSLDYREHLLPTGIFEENKKATQSDTVLTFTQEDLQNLLEEYGG